jgi:anti-sigma factor RsiW
MTCDRTEQVHAYHDGQLAPAARAEFESHVAGCAACAQQLRELRSISRMISTAAVPDISFATSEHYYDAWHLSRQRGLLRISSWLTAAAAAVLVGSLVLWPKPADTRGTVVAQDTGAWEAAALMPPPERVTDRPDQFIELAQWMAEDLSTEGIR